MSKKKSIPGNNKYHSIDNNNVMTSYVHKCGYPIRDRLKNDHSKKTDWSHNKSDSRE